MDGSVLEQKFCRFGDTLSVSDGTVIEGYASLFGKIDQGGDIVATGAYRASLAELKAKGCRVKMLWQHDPAQPIGVWDEVREDARGLWVKGRLVTETARGREAAALIAAGAIEGLSIGYRTKRAGVAPGGGRILNEVDLWEVSLVTFPMLPAARLVAKSDVSSTQDLHALASALRAASQEIKREIAQKAQTINAPKTGMER